MCKRDLTVPGHDAGHRRDGMCELFHIKIGAAQDIALPGPPALGGEQDALDIVAHVQDSEADRCVQAKAPFSPSA
jgi:hypothetical protein